MSTLLKNTSQVDEGLIKRFGNNMAAFISDTDTDEGGRSVSERLINYSLTWLVLFGKVVPTAH